MGRGLAHSAGRRPKDERPTARLGSNVSSQRRRRLRRSWPSRRPSALGAMTRTALDQAGSPCIAAPRAAGGLTLPAGGKYVLFMDDGFPAPVASYAVGDDTVVQFEVAPTQEWVEASPDPHRVIESPLLGTGDVTATPIEQPRRVQIGHHVWARSGHISAYRPTPPGEGLGAGAERPLGACEA
jgi:hypothetical protein